MTAHSYTTRHLVDIADALHRYDPRLQPGYEPPGNPIKRLPGFARKDIGERGESLCSMLLWCELPWYQAFVTDANGDKWRLDWRRWEPTEAQKAEQMQHRFEPEKWGRS